MLTISTPGVYSELGANSIMNGQSKFQGKYCRHELHVLMSCQLCTEALGPEGGYIHQVWSYWLLAAYFGLASLVSARAQWRRRAGVEDLDRTVDSLEHAAITLFHINLTVRALILAVVRPRYCRDTTIRINEWLHIECAMP